MCFVPGPQKPFRDKKKKKLLFNYYHTFQKEITVPIYIEVEVLTKEECINLMAGPQGCFKLAMGMQLHV